MLLNILKTLWSSKYTLPIILLVILVVSLVLTFYLTHLKRKVSSLEQEVSSLEEVLGEKEAEILYLKKSLTLVESYNDQKEKVIEDASKKKESIAEGLSEESKDWWNACVPPSVLDSLMCQ